MHKTKKAPTKQTHKQTKTKPQDKHQTHKPRHRSSWTINIWNWEFTDNSLEMFQLKALVVEAECMMRLLENQSKSSTYFDILNSLYSFFVSLNSFNFLLLKRHDSTNQLKVMNKEKVLQMPVSGLVGLCLCSAASRGCVRGIWSGAVAAGLWPARCEVQGEANAVGEHTLQGSASLAVG